MRRTSANEATTAEADRCRDSLILLQADNSVVYASQTVKNNMAGEERERDEKSILAETLSLSLFHKHTTYTHRLTSVVPLCTYRYTHSMSSRQ